MKTIEPAEFNYKNIHFAKGAVDEQSRSRIEAKSAIAMLLLVTCREISLSVHPKPKVPARTEELSIA